MSKYGVISGPYFPVFGLNTERYARKVSKYGVFSGPYFPAFGLNAGKYGPEITPYLDHFSRSDRVLLTQSHVKKRRAEQMWYCYSINYEEV